MISKRWIACQWPVLQRDSEQFRCVVLIGTITGIGGGTLRDLLLGRTVWWTQHPTELLLCMAAALATYFFIKNDIARQKAMIWSDALGLAAFGVLGCHVALTFGAPFVIAYSWGW